MSLQVQSQKVTQQGGNMKIGKYCVIDDDVVFGENVEVGDYCRIESGCKIGDNTKIRSYVELRINTIIGKDCYIDSGVKSSGNCKIGNEVTLRYDTIIARDVIVEDKVFIAPQCMTEYSDYKKVKHGGTIIGSHSFIGTNTTIAANIKICPGTVIARKSDINKDITKPAVYGSDKGKIYKIKDLGDDYWKDKTKPRGWPCVTCGRMLSEHNSPCPVSVQCNDCRVDKNPTCDKDYTTDGDLKHVKDCLGS